MSLTAWSSSENDELSVVGLVATLLVKPKPVPPDGEVTLRMITSPQLAMWTATGAMKSLSSAPNEDDERLLTKVLPKLPQVPVGKTPEVVRLMAASPKRPMPKLGLPTNGSLIVVVLT